MEEPPKDYVVSDEDGTWRPVPNGWLLVVGVVFIFLSGFLIGYGLGA